MEFFGRRKEPPKRYQVVPIVDDTDRRHVFFRRHTRPGPQILHVLREVPLQEETAQAVETTGETKERVKEVRGEDLQGEEKIGRSRIKSLMNKVLFPLFRRWIAGEDLESAVFSARELNMEGSGAILNCLGEHYKTQAEVEQTVREYLGALDTISEDVDYCLSIKLTQLGLDIDPKYCYENAFLLAQKTKEKGKVFWIDMESSKYTGDTIGVYSELLREGFENVGLCLQANLRRTEEDVRELLKLNKLGIFARIRFCKGAYKEKPEMAYQKREEVDESFRRLIVEFAKSDEGNVLGIATHDSQFLELARRIARARRNVEVQMLKGIEEDARRGLVKEDAVEGTLRVVTYLPYGEDFVAYGLRRIRKGRGTAALLIKSLYRG